MDLKASKLPIIGALIERLRSRSDHESVKLAMASKGDVTRMEGYKNMAACLERLRTLEGGSGSLGKPLRVAVGAHAALLQHRPAFSAAFGRDGSEGARLVYANACAALWHLTSLLCANGVTFVKGADGTYSPVLNKSGADGLAGSVFVTRLERFVDAADKHGFDQMVSESAPFVEREALAGNRLLEFELTIATVGLAAAGIMALLYVARDLAEKFYSLRGTFSRWLEVQARFLDMNAAALGTSKPVPRAKQEEYAARLRALADRIRVDDDDTERDAARSIQADDRRLRTVASAGAPLSATPQLL